MRRIVLGIAAGLLLTGLCLGILPVPGPGGESCGTAFVAGSQNIDGTANDVGDEPECALPRSQARQLPLALLMLGGLALLSQVPWARVIGTDVTDPGPTA